MVPHPWRQGIQKSADMIRNRSTSLKLEKTILINIYLTIMCAKHQRRWCGWRRRCLQPRIGRLRQFRHNRFVLWTYWHCPVAPFPWWQQGRQSEHGRRGGNLGSSRMFCLLSQWAPLEVVAEFGAPTTTGPLAWVLSDRGCQVLVMIKRGGGE